MNNQKLTRKEWNVFGVFLISCIMIGIAFINFSKLDVNGKSIYPNPNQGYNVLIMAALLLISTIVLTIKSFGTKNGLKLLIHELWPGLLYGGIIGTLVGFFLRAILPGKGYLIFLILLLIGGLYLVYYVGKKRK